MMQCTDRPLSELCSPLDSGVGCEESFASKPSGNSNAIKNDQGKPRFYLIDAGMWDWAMGHKNQARISFRLLLSRFDSAVENRSLSELAWCVFGASHLLHADQPELAMRWEMAQVLTRGAEKYSERGYRDGLHWSRIVNSALRHLDAYERGFVISGDDRCHHLAHFACCVQMLYEHIRDGLGVEDL